MEHLKIGDVVGDCSACDSTASVFYQGKDEAVCKKCHIVYSVDFERDVKQPEPEPVGKLDISSFVSAKEREHFDAVRSIPKNVAIEKKEIDDVELPDYIKSSLPWRWAHEFKRTGNPYRSGSMSYVIYDAVASKDDMTIAGLVQELNTISSLKPNDLLVIYEVLTQCVAAGLFIYDGESGKYSACLGTTKQAPLP